MELVRYKAYEIFPAPVTSSHFTVMELLLVPRPLSTYTFSGATGAPSTSEYPIARELAGERSPFAFCAYIL